jgi:hypothetical protein
MSLTVFWSGGARLLTRSSDAVLWRPCRWTPAATGERDDSTDVGRPSPEGPVTIVPAWDILVVFLEFVALFAITWIAWFAIISVYQILTKRAEARSGRQNELVFPAPPGERA